MICEKSKLFKTSHKSFENLKNTELTELIFKNSQKFDKTKKYIFQDIDE
jgi:hypothetical protein